MRPPSIVVLLVLGLLACGKREMDRMRIEGHDVGTICVRRERAYRMYGDARDPRVLAAHVARSPGDFFTCRSHVNAKGELVVESAFSSLVPPSGAPELLQTECTQERATAAWNDRDVTFGVAHGTMPPRGAANDELCLHAP